MQTIAKYKEIEIIVPDDAWYSFFNSPYMGHRLGTALDIYFKDFALFPVEMGTVEKIRRVKPPQRHVKGEDYLIAIRISESLCLKILHVMPRVKVGEKLYLGDMVGDMLISGFFMPWSSKHAHVEIRRCEDYLRARGGLELMPVIRYSVPTSVGDEFLIEEKSQNFCWAVPLHTSGYSLTPIASSGNPIEGGLPHYEYGAVFSQAQEIEFFNHKIKIIKELGNVGLFKFTTPLYANGMKIKGVGIYCNQPKIKVIGCNWKAGDVIRISAAEEPEE